MNFSMFYPFGNEQSIASSVLLPKLKLYRSKTEAANYFYTSAFTLLNAHKQKPVEVLIQKIFRSNRLQSCKESSKQ